MATPVTRGASQLTTGVERHVVRRGIAAVGLVSVALIHLLDVPGKFDELPYVGVLFVGLIITALLLAEAIVAEAMIRTDDLRVWLVAGAVSAATILGYAISRASGLPGDNGGDAGNWTEPLGLASLLVEGVVVLLVLGRLADRRTGVSH
jgi:hypothetical protein